MKPIPFLGGGLQGKSRTVTAQRKLNIYLEHRPDGEKGVKVVAYGTPGLKLLFTIASPVTQIRAIMGTPDSLYVVSGFTFSKIAPNGTTQFSSSINTAAGHVEMAYSPTQVVVADGANGYLFNGSTLVTIGAAFPNGANSITFVAGYFVAAQPGTQTFWVSNVFDGSTWNALAFAAASQKSDNISAVDNLSGILVIFSLAHMEFWQNVGATPEPFAPIQSASNQWGLAAISSRAHIDESIFFLGQSEGGQVQVCQLTGYVVKVVSTGDVDSVINKFTTVNDAVGLAYQIDEHKFYQLTFPSEDRTLVYDSSTGIWGESQTGHTTKYATRHMANLSTLFAGKRVVSDSVSANIYLFDPDTYTDNGKTIERELISRHAIDGYNEFTIDEIFLDVEVGVGLVSGQGSNPQMMMQVSRDDGKTDETEQWVPTGAMGNYQVRALWRRQGSARTFTIKHRYTEPTKFVIVNSAISVRERKQ